jgi:hypothetical protein
MIASSVFPSITLTAAFFAMSGHSPFPNHVSVFRVSCP